MSTSRWAEVEGGSVMTGLDEQIKAENRHHYSSADYGFILEKWNMEDAAKFIAEKDLITKEELNNLLEMINSPDRENYELAKMLIVTKQEQHRRRYTQNSIQDVSNIQTRKSQLSQPGS